jgi:riboflavin biosynthesis pyrimidine reductase
MTMFERSTTPDELFSYKLGSALTMEHKLVGILEELEQQEARSLGIDGGSRMNKAQLQRAVDRKKAA